MPPPPREPGPDAGPHGGSTGATAPSDPSPAKPAANRASKLLVLAGLVMLAALLYAGATSRARPSVALPPPVVDLSPGSQPATATAVFAGGCFWGVQAVFQHTRGVLNAVSGYAGGTADTATYPQVSSGKTGHAEAVAITYDPQVVSYGQLLQIFFSVAHDPTEVNRQGPDYGPQYRSAIFFSHRDEQQVAQQYIAQLDAAQALPRRIATSVSPLTRFYPAEDEHQDYATQNPHSIYIATYDRPKIDQFKALLPQLFRESPVLVSGSSPRQ